MTFGVKIIGAGALFFLASGLHAQKTDTISSLKTKVIDEVLIKGYGKTETKAKTTGSSTTISTEVLGDRPNATFLNSIQGTVPGVAINTSSGSPGSGSIAVRVRGMTSIGALTDPLYVIDGFISTDNEFRNINPNDIESLSVLKDAQATSIYGNFGANGVVVINTKSGGYNSALKISYDALTSISTLPQHHYNVADAREMLTLQNRYYQQSLAANPKLLAKDFGLGATMTQQAIDSYPINTNWEDEFYRTAPMQQHTLALKSGGQNINSYTSLGYLQQDGILKNTDFTRFTFRNTINGRSANKKFKYTAQTALGFSKRNQLMIETRAVSDYDFYYNPLHAPIKGAPYIAPYHYTGGKDMYSAIGRDILFNMPVVAYQNLMGGTKNYFTELSITGNVSASYDITDNLSISNKTGVIYKNNKNDMALSPDSYLALYASEASKTQYGGYETYNTTELTTINSVTSLSYNKSFGRHSVNLSGYMDYLRGFFQSSGLTQNGLNPFSWTLGAGSGYIPFNPADPTKYQPKVGLSTASAGSLAFIATAEYDFDGRFGLSGTVRRDGTYKFADDNKWYTFWSLAGRWNIDKEKFMQGSAFNMLKLRGSYGNNGNQTLAGVANNASVLFVGTNWVRNVFYSGDGYNGSVGYFTSLKNSELHWEKASQADIGLDFALWKNKVSGTFDIFEKIVSDVYLNTPVSGINGVYSIYANSGKLRNRGFEASIKYNMLRNKNWDVSIFGNTSYFKSKTLALSFNDVAGNVVQRVGREVWEWNLYKYIGVDPADGQLLFMGQDGNPTKAPKAADKFLTNKVVHAKYNGGFGFDVNFKGLYLRTILGYQLGGWGYDVFDRDLHTPGNLKSGYNVSKDLLNAWTKDRPTNEPSLTASNIGYLANSDKSLFRTDYLKLRSVIIGYSLNKAMLQNLPVRSLKIFLSGENIYSWTKWKGYDPETINVGYFNSIYPTSRTYSIGFSAEL